MSCGEILAYSIWPRRFQDQRVHTHAVVHYSCSWCRTGRNQPIGRRRDCSVDAPQTTVVGSRTQNRGQNNSDVVGATTKMQNVRRGQGQKWVHPVPKVFVEFEHHGIVRVSRGFRSDNGSQTRCNAIKSFQSTNSHRKKTALKLTEVELV